MNNVINAIRPSLMSLVAYYEAAEQRLPQDVAEDVRPRQVLEQCTEMTCLVMGVYTDVPLTFSALSNAAWALVRAARDLEGARAALALAQRIVRQSAKTRGEQVDRAVSPVSPADLKSYLTHSVPARLPRRVKGPHQPLQVLKQGFEVPSPEVIARAIEGLRRPEREPCEVS